MRRVKVPWSFEDWRGFPEIEQESRFAALLHSDAELGFDIAHAPLMRVALRRTTETSSYFIWSTHHLCIDGWSWPLVLGDVSRVYAALESGSKPDLSPALPFREYLRWLSESAPRSAEFWKAELAGFTGPTPFALSPPLPPNEAVALASESNSAQLVVRLTPETTAALQLLARNEHVTLSVVVNAAWALILSHYSGESPVIFGVAFSGRSAELADVETMVGPCVNNVPLCVAVDDCADFQTWLADIQHRQFGIAQQQYASLEQIQHWANVPWRHRLFGSLVVFQNYQISEQAQRIGTGASCVLLAAPEATNYALTLAVSVSQVLSVRLICRPDLLHPNDLQQIATDLSAVMQAMAGSTKVVLRDLRHVFGAATFGKAKALLAAQTDKPTATYAAPAEGAERIIASVWQELFGVERISLDDNFFDLGGHSIMLVQAHARLVTKLQRDLPIVALLQHPTVRTLAQYMSGSVVSVDAVRGTIDRAKKQREAQKRQRDLVGRR
jgi:acyl carrier protein